MKIVKQLFVFLILFSATGNAQSGFGTPNPDSSSILDLVSSTKGLLPPRMTSQQRDLISNPATGLIIFNTNTNVLEHNTGTTALVKWASILETTKINLGFDSVNAVGTVTTDALQDVLVPEMMVTPPEGSYLVTFESQYNNLKTEVSTTVNSGGISTGQGVKDLQKIYEQLSAKIVTNATHGAIMGNGEILAPGVYAMASAVTLLETLILDGQNDPDSVFVFKIAAAFNAGAGAKVVLKNGAKACNVFWVIEAAIVLGADSKIIGMLLSHGAAVGAGANSVIEGRMFSTAAAISTAADFIAIPYNCSYIDLGVLSTFVMFTSIGAITNTAIATINGDIGSNLGAITGFEAANLNGKIYTPDTAVIPLNTVTTITKVDNANKVLSTFGIYQNGVLIPSSTKALISSENASNISLQAIATIAAGEPIEVRWKTDSDTIEIGNRTLTVIKIP